MLDKQNTKEIQSTGCILGTASTAVTAVGMVIKDLVDQQHDHKAACHLASELSTPTAEKFRLADITEREFKKGLDTSQTSRSFRRITRNFLLENNLTPKQMRHPVIATVLASVAAGGFIAAITAAITNGSDENHHGSHRG